VKRDQLSKYNAVALNVSCPGLDVMYSWGGHHDGTFIACLLLSPFACMAVEALIESHEDSKNTAHVKEALGEKQFERILGNYFLEEFTKANLFRKVNYYSYEDNYKALIDEGYDSIIKLKIEELCLKRAGRTDKLNLHVSIVAKMVDIQNEQVIWSQHELIISDEEHTFDEYKADGAKLLKELVDKSLRKIGFRLAYNIMYTK